MDGHLIQAIKYLRVKGVELGQLIMTLAQILYTKDIPGNRNLIIWNFSISISMNSPPFVLFDFFFTPPNEFLMQLPDLNKEALKTEFLINSVLFQVY